MFYDNFVNLCNKVGKSPSAVAVEIGFQKSVVTRWKQNNSTPTDANLKKIADYFGITVDQLMNPSESSSSNNTKPVNNDVRLALFGGDSEVTDEMWEEALFAAQLIKERYKRKKD